MSTASNKYGITKDSYGIDGAHLLTQQFYAATTYSHDQYLQDEGFEMPWL